MAQHKTCPKCRAECVLADFVPPPFIQLVLDELPVYCSNKIEGCAWSDERGSLAEHLRRFYEHGKCEFSNAGCETKGSFQKLHAHIEEECEYAPRKQERVAKELESLCDALNPVPEDRVKLNVGGTRFETSRATLSKYPLSVLGIMFSGRRKLRESEDGVVFLDVVPRVFGYVLAWLQQGVHPSNLDSYEAELLLQHAKQLRLNDLVVALGGETVVKTRGGPVLSQDKLLTYMQVSGCGNGGSLSLPGANLSGHYLAGARLEKAILTGAMLRGTDFGRANLSGCDLSGADLDGADLRQANLSGGNLTGCSLRGAVMDGANLSNAKLTECDLSNTNLRSADLSRAVLDGAKLIGAVLNGANMTRTELSGRNFSGFDLRNTIFDHTKLAGVNITSANLGGTSFSGVNLAVKDAVGTVLVTSILSNETHTKTTLKGAILTGADLKGYDFSGFNSPELC